MTTTRQEFKDLANELINDEFADFRRTLTITEGGSYDPTTETVTGATTASYQAIRQKLTFKEYQLQAIQVTDFAVVYTSTVKPLVSATCVYDGSPCHIVSSTFDGADAAVRLILRAI